MMQHLLDETPEGSAERLQHSRARQMHDDAIDRFEGELERLGLYCVDRTLGKICFPAKQFASVWTWRVGQCRNVFLVSAHDPKPRVDADTSTS